MHKRGGLGGPRPGNVEIVETPLLFGEMGKITAPVHKIAIGEAIGKVGNKRKGTQQGGAGNLDPNPPLPKHLYGYLKIICKSSENMRKKSEIIIKS